MANVLVVDDEKGIRITFAAFLKSAGHTVLTAESVDEAIRLVDANPVDVVVSDILLPRRSGLDLLDHVRQTWPHVPVILVTGQPGLDSATAAVRAPAFDYLSKPMPMAALLEVVARAAAEKAQQDEHARLDAANRRYQEELERRVEERTGRLRESEARLRAQYQWLPLPTFTWRQQADDLVLTDCNQAAIDVSQGKATEWIGARATDLYQDRQHIVADLRRCLAERQVTRREIHSEHFLPGRLAIMTCVFVPPDLVMVHVEDISERRRAEEAAQAASAYARSLIEVSLDPLVTISADGRITDVNEASVQATGVPRDRLIGTDFSGFFTEPEMARQGYQRAFSEGTVRDYPLAIRHVSGRVTDVLYNASVYRDEQGQVRGVFAAARDITERKRADEALRASEERLRVGLNTVNIAVFNQDLDLRYVWAYRPQLGYTAEQILGHTDAELLPTEAARLVMALKRRVLERGLRERAEVPVCVGGRTRIYDLVAEPLRDLGGAIIGLTGASLDITERKQAEAAARASEERYRTLFETMDEGFCVVDMLYDQDGKAVDYRFVEVNPAFEKHTGLREALGKTIRQMVPDHDAHWFEIYGNVARTGEAIRFAAPATAMQRHYDVFAFRIGMDQSQRVGILFSDITGRKQAAEELRESEERYRSLFENSLLPISQALPDGRLIAANAAYARLYGYASPEQMLAEVSHVGRQLYANPDDRDAVLRTLAGKGEMEPREFEVLRRDGTRFVVVVGARAIRDATGKLLCYQAVHMDISARKQAEEALRRSEHKYRRLHETMTDAFVLVDLAGHILECNQTYSDMLGYREAELSELTYLDFTPEKWHAMEGRIVQEQVLPQGFSGVYEKEYRRRDGAILPVELRTFLVRDDAGQPLAMWAIVRDITERKRADELLRASREQMRALAGRLQAVREEERTRVAREIHDVLAQDLTRLKIDLVWLQGRLARSGKAAAPEALAARVAEMAGIADGAIQAVQRIATELRPAVLDSLGLCAAVEWQARDFQAHAGIPCAASVPDAELPVDQDVATAAFRILQESLTNVQRHAHATRVAVLLSREAGQLVLRIEDNGCGMGPEVLSNPLSIGLAGMRERALLLGGCCEVRSQPGSGTIIDVRLPLAASGAHPGPDSE